MGSNVTMTIAVIIIIVVFVRFAIVTLYLEFVYRSIDILNGIEYSI